jgi:hypothetical protein
MNELHLTLTLDEINKILGHVGKAPYQEVFEVISKISLQAQQQMQVQEAKQAPPSLLAE